MKKKLTEILATELEFLFFRPVKLDMARLGNYYLAFGVFTAWLVGIGRYWDNPRAELWQILGLGSVAYIFSLAWILWLLIWPLKPANWSYKGVLTFVGMTSPPAILYAIPVERIFPMKIAASINIWFLAIVALWRIILLFLYLKRAARLEGFTIVIAALLPLTLIVTALAALNLEHVVFRLMAGIAEHELSANDKAYYVLVTITFFSVIASPLFLLAYLGLVWKRRRQ